MENLDKSTYDNTRIEGVPEKKEDIKTLCFICESCIFENTECESCR